MIAEGFDEVLEAGEAVDFTDSGADDVVVVGVLADTSPSGVPLGIDLPGSKKMNWWTESSWLKPSRRLVRIVTAPVYGLS